MNKRDVYLKELQNEDYEQFIIDNQEAFRYGALEEFGMRDNHFEEDGEIISKATIENSINNGIAYRILYNNIIVGGTVVKINGIKGELELLFVKPEYHSLGIGYACWCLIEEKFSSVKIWETYTPYFETRNIHFYVNRCKFHIVEYYNEHYRMNTEENNVEFESMFKFEKRISD